MVPGAGESCNTGLRGFPFPAWDVVGQITLNQAVVKLLVCTCCVSFSEGCTSSMMGVDSGGVIICGRTPSGL